MAIALFDRNQRIKNRLDRQFNRIIQSDLKFGISRFKLQSIENDIQKLEVEKNENKEKLKLHSWVANLLMVIAAALFDIVLCQDSAPKLTERVAWFPTSQITIPIIIVVIEMCLANFVLQGIFQKNEGNKKSWKNLLPNGENIKYIINIILTALFIFGLPLLSYTTYLDEIASHDSRPYATTELSLRFTVILGFSLISHIVIALNYRKILQSFRELLNQITNYMMGNTIIKKRMKFNRIKKQSIELLRATLEKSVEFIREVLDIQNSNPIDEVTRRPTNSNLPTYVLPSFPRELSYAVVNYFGYNIIPTHHFQLQPALYRDPVLIFESILSNNERKEAIGNDIQRREQENQAALRGRRNDQDRLTRERNLIEGESIEEIERNRRRRQLEQENQPVGDINVNGNRPQEEIAASSQEEDDPHREDDFTGLFGEGE